MCSWLSWWGEEGVSQAAGGQLTGGGCESYHFDGAECDNGVTTPAVGPGVPARILPLLKHVLLPLTVGLLVPHPSEEAGGRDRDSSVPPWAAQTPNIINNVKLKIKLICHQKVL